MQRTILLIGAVFLLGVSDASALSITQPTATKGIHSAYVKLTWPANYYAKNGYIVYRTPTENYYNAVKLGTTKNRQWLDRTASQGRRYWYWVVPKGYYLYSGQTAGNSQSGYKYVTIPKPVVSQGKSTTTLYLSWSSSPQALYGYWVWRCATPYFSSAYRMGVTYNCYYYDTQAYPGRVYYYWIAPRCFNMSPYNVSKYGWGYLALGVPTPSGSVSGNSVYLSWSSVNGAQYYNVYRGTSSNIGSAQYVGYTYGTSFTDTISSGHTYYWWICPVDIEGDEWYNASKYTWYSYY
ncbi:MAG: hypothetical protein IJS32_08710 [Kiritimatiellae bacterium]|nr:hypothetical protein [Kiritimatiellia bacterium]